MSVNYISYLMIKINIDKEINVKFEYHKTYNIGILFWMESKRIKRSENRKNRRMVHIG